MQSTTTAGFTHGYSNVTPPWGKRNTYKTLTGKGSFGHFSFNEVDANAIILRDLLVVYLFIAAFFTLYTSWLLKFGIGTLP